MRSSSHHSHQQSPTVTLPQINISEFDALLKPAGKRVVDDWETGVKALGNLPGYKYSATFISSLRANLVLSAASSPTSSSFNTPISTPTTTAFSHAAQPTPSPLSISHSTTQTMPQSSIDRASLAAIPTSSTTSVPATADEIPTLAYEVVPSSDQESRIAALKLIADSVAQQRQTASRAIIFHPAVMATVVLLIALATQYVVWTTIITTGMGIVMAGLLGVRLLTSPYIALAEEINFGWLDGTAGGGFGGSSNLGNTSSAGNEKEKGVTHKRTGSDEKNKDPIIVISKWGDEIMGALVMRFVKKERKGYVRAYTVRLRYRNKGVGEGLLEEAVKTIWTKGGRDVVFDEGHANSRMILPSAFNGVFKRNENKAKEKLAIVLEAQRKEKSNR